MMVPGKPPSMVNPSTSTAERISAVLTSMPKQAVQMVDMARYCMAVVGMAYTMAESREGMMPTRAPKRCPKRSASV